VVLRFDWFEKVAAMSLRNRSVTAALCVLHATFALAAPTPSSDHYSLEDFQRVDKIDAHVHINGCAEQFMAQASSDGVRVLTINVDYPDFPPIDIQQRDAVALRKKYPGRVAFAATFSVADFQSPDWAANQLSHLDAAFAQGAVGVKVWKNIGLALRDPDGNRNAVEGIPRSASGATRGQYVMVDDPRLKPIFDRLERGNIVVLGHQAEPLNCWLPFEKMTIRSDRDYFREHPQYYMYRHPEIPSHEAQLAARDHMLAQHPLLRFDSVHLASLEWDVTRIAHFLDRFPKANVDVAARMSHLEYQATRNRQKVRQFMLRYQDRILYGTDIEVAPEGSATAAAEAHKAWVEDWRFLNTAEEMHSTEFEPAFRGLALPKAVVEKIYSGNARKMYPGAWD
jgi:predicted TIM-barrel fold metal-dependent hydrolase